MLLVIKTTIPSVVILPEAPEYLTWSGQLICLHPTPQIEESLHLSHRRSRQMKSARIYQQEIISSHLIKTRCLQTSLFSHQKMRLLPRHTGCG